MNLYKKLFSYGWFGTKTRCDTEARANSKMAYLRTKTHEILPAWFFSTLRYGMFHYSDAVLIFQLQISTSVSMTKNSARCQLASSYLCSFAWSVFSNVRIFSSFLRTDWSSLLFKLRVSSNLKEKKKTFVTASIESHLYWKTMYGMTRPYRSFQKRIQDYSRGIAVTLVCRIIGRHASKMFQLENWNLI